MQETNIKMKKKRKKKKQFILIIVKNNNNRNNTKINMTTIRIISTTSTKMTKHNHTMHLSFLYTDYFHFT